MCEVAYSLLDDVGGDGSDVAFAGAFFVVVGDEFCDAERGGVEGCLGDEAIGEGDSEEACYAGCCAKEEYIPMETRRFAKREFCALGYEGGDCILSVNEKAESWVTRVPL